MEICNGHAINCNIADIKPVKHQLADLTVVSLLCRLVFDHKTIVRNFQLCIMELFEQLSQKISFIVVTLFNSDDGLTMSVGHPVSHSRSTKDAELE